MKSNLLFINATTKEKSSCNDHFDVEYSSIHLPWEGIYVEKGSSTHFNPENVYSSEFLFSLELSYEFSWNVTNGEKEKQVQTQIGSIWLNAPNATINHINNNPAEHLAFTITPEELYKNYDGYLPTEGLEFLTDYSIEDPLLENILRMFCSETKANNPNGLKYVKHLKVLFANYFIDHYSNIDDLLKEKKHQSSVSPEDIHLLEQYILANISESITIDELANKLDMNKFMFLKEFKKHTGITPYQYLLSVRIEKAKDLLINTKESIVNIALDLGFSDSSHFSKTYSKVVGQTPRQYRKHHQ